MEVACFHNILKSCMLAQMHGYCCKLATREFVLVTVVQIGVLFSELISTRVDGLLALCNSHWAQTIASCPIPNAYITVHIHTLYIELP